MLGGKFMDFLNQQINKNELKYQEESKNLISADDNRNNYGKFGKDNEIIQAEKYGLSPSNSKFLFMYLILI